MPVLPSPPLLARVYVPVCLVDLEQMLLCLAPQQLMPSIPTRSMYVLIQH
jgi:hypothetical protein